MKLDDRGVDLLSEAIVAQACVDYAEALAKKINLEKRLLGETRPEKTRVIRHGIYFVNQKIKDCEGFFKSEWFNKLSSVSADTIIEKIKNSITTNLEGEAVYYIDSPVLSGNFEVC